MSNEIDEKPDFENDDLKSLMEEEMRAVLKQRAQHRKWDKIAIRIVLPLAILTLLAMVAFPIGCVYYGLKNYNPSQGQSEVEKK